MAQVLYYLSTILILSTSTLCGAIEDRKLHIVYMGSLPQGEYSPLSHHLSILQEVLNESVPTNSLIRSYQRSLNGFAAMLTNQEAQKLASMKEIVSVFPSTTYQLYTTRSWDFMGFHETIKRKPAIESDIIIGLIDTGIWPESESFSDQGFGPPPKKWKGACKGGKNFTCNNKIIGARHYTNESNTSRDDVGHGTHTASIAAGNKVKDANFYGLAQGTARGGVPSARIAAYKVCADDGCDAVDILAAFDDSIADGVDIISISIGNNNPLPFDYDVMSIGAFHAMERGILTVQAAGNLGMFSFLVSSVAPWVLTVGASTTDRQLIDKIVLGNGKTIIGKSVNSFTLNGSEFPLIYQPETHSYICNPICGFDCVNSSLVGGKIVLCDWKIVTLAPYMGGAAGLLNPQDSRFPDFSRVVPVPESDISRPNIDMIVSYINSTRNPTANILKSEAIWNSSAPMVASFSLRGPNAIVHEIMKPDIIAPGVEILSAYSPFASPSDSKIDKRSLHYNLLSGTSMACPHVAGVAAYVKTFHPDWSPSAVKSAIMTTAWPMNSSLYAEGAFAFGSGHINPIKAIDPGLVYESHTEDYIKMLCGLGYSADKIRKITRGSSTCEPVGSNITLVLDLNYPAMTTKVKPNKNFNVTFHRTLTNVGLANSTYNAKFLSLPNIDIKVTPQVLSFKTLNEKKTFSVTLTGKDSGDVQSTTLVWSDGTYNVQSPIIVFSKIMGE